MGSKVIRKRSQSDRNHDKSNCQGCVKRQHSRMGFLETAFPISTTLLPGRKHILIPILPATAAWDRVTI
jgi:hypothetical protein